MIPRWKKISKDLKPQEAKHHRTGSCLGVTWTGGRAGAFLDILPLAGRASVQRGGVGAAPTPLLPATPTDSAARRPCGPRGPAAVDCPRHGDGGIREGGGEDGGMEGQSSQDYPTCTKERHV